jgi:UDP-3-O-[3-hydroxymyristoyl] glucosamine N-acyltransferase
MQFTAQQVAAMLGGTIEGNPDAVLSKPTAIETGESGGIAFLSNPKYEPYLYSTTASAVLISNDLVLSKPVMTTLIRVADVRQSLNVLLGLVEKYTAPKRKNGIHAQTVIEEGANLGENVAVGAFSCISKGATIGENGTIETQVFIGENVKIGKNVRIYSGVKIYYNTIIGDNCIIHANVVIGSDGFGFAPDENTVYHKVPQIGNVVIGNDVEIGANCTIDRATMGTTRLGNGVKLDNLVQIAHNVEVGDHTVMAAQSGIAGSSKVGKYCRIGGQVGIVGHITVADGTQVQAQSGIARNVKEKNTALAGTPAFDYVKERRTQAIFRTLPEMELRLREVEKGLKNLNE